MIPMRAKSIVACLVLILTAFASRSNAAEAIVARMTGIIGPSSARFMVEAIERAEERRAECVILEMDTPGGLDESMRQIVKKIMTSRVPVVVYVAPSGSRAASAGVFITMAAHVAAMAPGTNIGAAHPVSIGLGAKVDSVMAGKTVNDAAAYARSIAGRRGRNADWAEDAVRESVSISETEALKLGVIDLIAPSLKALLDSLDGRTVAIEEKTFVLNTKDAAIVEMKMSWSDRLLAVITNPNVAYVLFMLGLLGLYFELSTPGAVLPGVVGAICLILAFFAFQVLSVSYTGVLLIILAIVLFIVDVKAATHGALTVGGLVAMTFGSIMLFNDPDPALRVSLQVIVPVVLVTGAFFVVGVYLSIRSLRKRPTTGGDALVGQEGDARTPVDGKGGRVFVAGAHWNAFSDGEIAEGKRVRVVEVKGMSLKVEEIR
jgi:membrane-bound serine protease (ClpP class)